MAVLVSEDPVARARLTGVFYLVTTVSALFASIFVRGSLVVGGDAASTARHIAASEQLFRLGFAADILADLAYVAVTYLLYDLLRPVNRRLSAAAALFSLTGCVVGAVAALGHLAALIVLKNPAILAAFSTAQVQSLALLALKLHGQGYEISLVYFGVYCALIGVLILQSPFLPKTIGVLMVLAGAAYAVDTTATFLFPSFSNPLVDNVAMLALLGEGALTLWLIVFGVNGPQWLALAASRQESA